MVVATGEKSHSPFCIYFVFCICSQIFLSYSGGGLPASLDTIQKRLVLSDTEIGLLVAMDKIGQTVAAPFWGRALQGTPTKPLLLGAYLLAASSIMVLALVPNIYFMLPAMLCYGICESLQVVWGTVWILSNAPSEMRAQWMSFGAIGAGAGTWIGACVAGYVTANHFSYSIAFVVQACLLGVSCLSAAVTPSESLDISVGTQDALDGPGDASAQAQLSTKAQLSTMLGTPLYRWTLLCIPQVYFVQSGLQSLWVRLFCEGPWALSKNTVVTSCLIALGIGGTSGAVFGPILVDKYGGFGDDEGKYRSLRIMRHFTSLSACAGIVAILVISLKMFSVYRLESELQDPRLWLVWTVFVGITICLTATATTFTSIAVESVPREMQTLASGVAVCVGNLLGYAGGPFWPGALMDLIRVAQPNLELASRLGWAANYVCLFTVTLLATAHFTARTAMAKLNVESQDCQSLLAVSNP
eukprot:TRINITY_DN26802_c0_g1_i1.p1 TRINITY_DN26802_c0_g1~~TRINITY_DN26802_c0_g1_i1.p1  ORF type:complete len:471 (+),score=42.95 TRINITY_DN26802_c0_g1_i1:152-1564(+)